MRKTLCLVLCSLFLFSCNTEIKKEKEVVINEIKNSAETQKFWNSLKALCKKSYEGTLVFPENDEQFSGKKLVMHARSCNDNIIKIPFFVGENKSRTWVFKLENDRITLKHDHRHEDGSDDEITMYGGTTTNSGQASLQIFPADEKTQTMIPAASSNVWWVTLDDKQFTYNLRRLGTPRVFRVSFDLTKTIENPEAPWGWKD